MYVDWKASAAFLLDVPGACLSTLASRYSSTVDRTNCLVIDYWHVHVDNVSSNKDKYSVVCDTEALDFAFL